jgi:DNA-binding transcriptional MerR regulator|nr:Cd(II)/Pb(II)-responsive transcriptional regulator [Bdellovibrio sp. HAGR004]
MRIGELSKKVGVSIDSIRFYEKEGLIKSPVRAENGYREFSKDAEAVLEFISHCRSLDIPLPEVQKLLRVRAGSTKSCREANQVIDDQLAKLRSRILELKRLEKTLSELRSVCNSELDPKDCRIIQSLQAR